MFLLDAEVLRNNCRRFKSAFEHSGANCEFLYAVKANFEAAVLGIIAREKYGALIGSEPEGTLAKRSGFSKPIFLYTSCLRESEIEYAINNSMVMVADSARDLKRIERIARRSKKVPEVGLRYDSCRDESSKFGVMDSEFVECGRAFGRSRVLRFTTLGVHLGTHLLEVAKYRQAICRIAIVLAKLTRLYGIHLGRVSLGGGFTSIGDVAEQLVPIEEVASSIVSSVREEFDAKGLPIPTLTLEPGRFIVNDAVKCLGTIHSVKGSKGKRKWAYCDVASSFLPKLDSARYMLSTVAKHDTAPLEFDVGGPLGVEHDVLARGIRLRSVREGAVIVVSNCGAYTLSMASNFNRTKPAMLLLEGRRVRLARPEGEMV